MDFQKIPSPAYVLERRLLRQNLELMKRVQQESGANIILALKGFSLFHVFPFVKQYLAGATASSLYEAQLIFEEMGVKAHTYSPAYVPEHFEEVMAKSGHITFNSLSQWRLYKDKVANSEHEISCGIRVNPEYSDVETDLYNPALPGSRLGELIENFEEFSGTLPQGIEGLHCHTLCESSADSFEKLLAAFEKRFGHFIPQLKWVNFGGGHLMTRKDYDVEKLIRLVKAFKAKHNIEVILEPGSAVGWQTGFLVASVLDIVNSRGIKTLILDVSFTAHMPDTLEMPYRPKITGANEQPVEGKPTYRIGGNSCLAGDFHYEYSFENEVKVGDKIILEDMLHYTLVKTTMFNGVYHPRIAILEEDDSLNIVRTFEYSDYRNRMG
ncbi:MAG: carboxynorspermidine decarboxylase [Saprospiraceae bacterium]|nr:carboxynorspermidine decarboxylase [Saprospiraceae bacterium]